MPQPILTPAEREKERKRREEAWRKILIAYYLNLEFREKQEQEIREYKPQLLIAHLAAYIREQRLLQKLMEKEPGRLSAMELLEKMERFQEEDSPFRRLLRDIKENPAAEEKINRSLSECIAEAPARILKRGRSGGFHVKGDKLKKLGLVPEDGQPAQDPAEEERTRYEMAFLRCVMPPELFRKLCSEMVKQGRMKDPEREFLFVPEEVPGLTCEEYVAQHKAEPREREGELGNQDEVLTSAAYMLAAFEQKDAGVFDEKKADARAMELSGSRAFKAYIDEHPGSLLAAARNTGVEAVHRELTALDAEIRRRDGILCEVRDAMRAKSGGKSAAYHQVMNGISRFLHLVGEPEQQDKDALALKLAKFVMTEGDPKSPDYEKNTCLQATRALQAMLPEKDFKVFLVKANEKRPPEEQLRPEDLERLAAMAKAPERTDPVPERNSINNLP